ncbi:uncharacterized protein LOC141724202 [Apium graveolens]|uniref:uncharacterized protein LOC141724202 n=1 Tax=Apium graveolens TaxID=4045 RepID=UPI003D799849
MLKNFRTYVGSVVRFQVDINIESWDLVNQGLKDAIWEDIKIRWNLDDSRKKNVLERAGKQWRDFKGKLTKNYFREGKDPCEKYNFITEDTWKTFKQRRETPEFKEICEKAKESQKHNEHVHYLGPSGYASKRTKWSIDDPIASLNDPDCSNLSLLSTEHTGRGFDWLRARARADGQGGHYFPNKKTKDVCLTMNELHNQASEGSWTPQGHDDLLARALGNKEHGGRVRGVGGGVKIKDVFKSGPRRHSGLVSTDELATITEEIRKKVQKECEEMMNSKLEGIFNQLKQMGVSLEADQFVNDAGARKVDNARSSCHSVDPEDYFSTIKVPTLCRLCVIYVERGKVVAARGTLFPTNKQGKMIHNNPIAPQNVRVSVDDVITEYQLTPLYVPCYEHETIGYTAGSFVQWPKDLVMLGQDPILENKKLHEMTPIQKSSKVESKGSVTPLKQSPQVVGDDINSSDHCAGLSFLLKKRPPSKKSDAFIFEENGDGPIYITLEDVNQVLRMRWLNIPIVELFVKYVSKLCKQLKDDKFAFMLPSRLAIPHNHEQQKRKDEATDYMTSLLVANKDKRYILAPYIQEDHWMLLLFCLNESAI